MSRNLEYPILAGTGLLLALFAAAALGWQMHAAYSTVVDRKRAETVSQMCRYILLRAWTVADSTAVADTWPPCWAEFRR